MSSFGGSESEENVCNYFLQLSEEQILVALPFGQRLYVKGKVKLFTVLLNQIEIQGYIFDSESHNYPQDIFSPRGYSLLYFESVSHPNNETADFKNENYNTKKVKKFVKTHGNSCTIFILEKFESKWTRYLEDAFQFSDNKKQKMAIFGREKWKKDTILVPEVMEEILDVNFILKDEFQDLKVRLLNAKGQWNFTNPREEWEVAVKSCNYTLNHQEHPRLIGIGGKGVGKSTMLRYIANRLIQEYGKILWIDLDPGQAEFTLPGYMCCTIVTEPLLGPNFTHLAKDNNIIMNIFLGTVNVSDVAQRYMKSVEYIVENLNKRPDLLQIPWVVNTMGFTRGLGISLLKKSVTLIKPTTFIEIKSRFSKKNYECSMQQFCTNSLPKCNYMSFRAVPESDGKDMNSHDFWGIPEAYKLRDIVILSYLGQRFPQPIQSLTPFSISFDDVKVQLLQFDKKSITTKFIPASLNMTLVSLGTLVTGTIDKNSIIESKGCALIRAVDPIQKLFYVLTDLNAEVLETINCFTSGSIALPNGVFLTKIFNKLKHSPYVAAKPQLETPLNVPWQRSGKPRLNEFQPK